MLIKPNEAVTLFIAFLLIIIEKYNCVIFAGSIVPAPAPRDAIRTAVRGAPIRPPTATTSARPLLRTLIKLFITYQYNLPSIALNSLPKKKS